MFWGFRIWMFRPGLDQTFFKIRIRPKHSDPDPQPLTETWQTCRNQGVGTKTASVYFALLGKRVRGPGVNQWRRDFLYLAMFWL